MRRTRWRGFSGVQRRRKAFGQARDRRGQWRGRVCLPLGLGDRVEELSQCQWEHHGEKKVCCELDGLSTPVSMKFQVSDV